jgi:hypothetical protein
VPQSPSPPADVEAEATPTSALARRRPAQAKRQSPDRDVERRAFNRLTSDGVPRPATLPSATSATCSCIVETLRAFASWPCRRWARRPRLLAALTALGDGWAFLSRTSPSARPEPRASGVRLRSRAPAPLRPGLRARRRARGLRVRPRPGRQFARTPYGVSFVREPNVFTLVTCTSCTAMRPGTVSGSCGRSPSGLPIGAPRRRVGRERDRARRLQHRPQVDETAT